MKVGGRIEFPPKWMLVFVVYPALVEAHAVGGVGEVDM